MQVASLPLLFDMGLPMIFPSMFLMLLALIPVIFVEGYLITRLLKVREPAGYRASALGNLVSTIVGIPVTWFILAVLQMLTGGGSAYGIDTVTGKVIAFTWQAPWLIPYFPEAAWLGYAAMIFLLIPYFLASWCIEYLVSRRLLANALYSQLEKESGRAETDEYMRRLETEALFPSILRAIRSANLVSYGCLAALVAIPLIYVLSTK